MDATPKVVGDAEIDAEGVRLTVEWTQDGNRQSATYWVSRGEMQSIARQARALDDMGSSTQHLFMLFETQVRRLAVEKHAERQAALRRQ